MVAGQGLILPKIAIVGRPNVGKSTLFNRLTGKKVAIVDDQPGVTRDRREGRGSLGEMRFEIVDTAGYEDAHDDSLQARMRAQTMAAVTQADCILMVVDARVGVTPLDHIFADQLRKSGKPCLLLANKCEGRAGEVGLMEAYELGLGDPIPFSAEHGEGLVLLFESLRDELGERVVYDIAGDDTEEEILADNATPSTADTSASEEDIAFEAADFNDADDMGDGPVAIGPDFYEGDDRDSDFTEERPLQLAIVGRPNVGKSTLINQLIGQDRLLTGPEAGITRDSIAIDWQWWDKSARDGAGAERTVRLIDTAGLRKKARIEDRVEYLSGVETRRSINFAEVVVLVLDAEDMLEKQDLTIARYVIDEGRALIIAVNKWDKLRDHRESLTRLQDRLATSLTQVRGIPVVTISALQGRNLDRLIAAAFAIRAVWSARISTAKLNRWLAYRVQEHAPPLVKGRRVKIRYMTQAKSRPPSFALFLSQAEALPESYLRFLTNGLRDDFGLDGVPIRMMLRKRENPFASRGKK